MDRDVMAAHLERAERHVTRAMLLVSRQRQIVAQLEHAGHTATGSRRILDLFEQVLMLQIAARDRLIEEMGQAD